MTTHVLKDILAVFFFKVEDAQGSYIHAAKYV